MNSKADDFRQQIGRSRRQSYHRLTERLAQDDPELGWVLYYTMEFVEGEPLKAICRRGPLAAP